MEALTLHKLILDVLVKGAWIRNSTTRQSVEDFSNAVNALRKRRNGVAHGVYGPETTKPGTLYRIEMRGFNNIISPDGSPITVKTLQELAAELRVVQEKGLALTSALKKAQRK